MLDGNFANDFDGDPLSGPDGIYYRDRDTDGDGIADAKILRVELGAPSAPSSAQLVADPGDCPATGFCFVDRTEDLLTLGELDAADFSPEVRFVDALAVQTDVEVVVGGAVTGTAQINPQLLSNLDLQTLNAGATIRFDVDSDGLLDTIQFGTDVLARFSGSTPGTFQDLDGNRVSDLDQDLDGTLDFVDDGAILVDPNSGAKTLIASFGPVSDDNVLCGSGIPGDPLQEALQLEFADKADYAAVSAIFPDFPVRTIGPNGELGQLPPRSPVFCRGLSGLLGVTAFSLPFKRAGGAAGFGRRDFLWQGGREVVLSHQKKNVFGFSLDFAEDYTKTSWGIEFSWTSGKIFGNTLSADGQHRSDEYVLSVSMSRPTLINFLNPNRTFFFNVQVFVRYFSDFVGGRDDNDGMFGTANSQWDTRMILFFFTGYFQDQLTPRVLFVYDPPTSTAAALTQLSYRFNERFSAIVGYNSFFGKVSQIQSRFFPIGPGLTHPDFTSEVLRGLAPARNRDEIFLRVRYTF